jgi:thymidylate synthase
MIFSTSTQAFVHMLDRLSNEASTVSSRNGPTKELMVNQLIIQAPRERFYIIPKRHNNPFAQLAETLWVMAGKDDIVWLSYYLPRAPLYSDDGKTWRAAYGKRLRNWDGCIDQVATCYNILKDDPQSRRAVMSIFDPARDYSAASKDIPCNNWLNWYIREGRLHLVIAQRSSDLLWGFSGINSFEFSLMQEAMASWLEVEVGNLTFNITSLHYYMEHDKRVKAILDAYPHTYDRSISAYDFGIKPVPWSTPFKYTAGMLDAFFSAETIMREGDVTDYLLEVITDPFLNASTRMMAIYSRILAGDTKRVMELVNSLPPNSDFKVAAIEYLTRNTQDLAGFELTTVERNFFDTFLFRPGKTK